MNSYIQNLTRYVLVIAILLLIVGCSGGKGGNPIAPDQEQQLIIGNTPIDIPDLTNRTVETGSRIPLGMYRFYIDTETNEIDLVPDRTILR